ncbi:glycosyltransferase family 4 protein [candidate division WOR-3 bacterium]|nr:glycosyltransferase family 4 protein [candidate division WOR-3 bacterium]
MFELKVLSLSLFSLAVSSVGARLVLGRVGRGAPIDVPNRRSSHDIPTATAGGIGLALSLVLALLIIGSRSQGESREGLILFAVAAALIAAVGLWDDFRNPPIHWRLLLQVGAAMLVIGGGMALHGFSLPWGPGITFAWAAVPLTLLWITSLTNLFNFIDGADGLANSLAVVCSVGVAAAAFATGHPFEGAVAVAVTAACLGFLWYNFPPAQVFMGGVGSLTLGFVLSVLAIRLAASGSQPVPMMFFVILYSSFLFDTSYTLLRRILRGEKFWQAHRTHLYERLLQSGWSHLRVTLFYVGLGLVSLALAIFYLRAGSAGRTAVVALQLVICLVHLMAVKVQEARARVVPQGEGPDQVSADRRGAVVTRRRLVPYMPYSRFGRLRVVDRFPTAMKDPQRRGAPKPRVVARRQRPRRHPHESRTS